MINQFMVELKLPFFSLLNFFYSKTLLVLNWKIELQELDYLLKH